MDSTTAGLVGALIGSLAGILGSVVNSYSQIRLEREKWERSVKSQHRQELLEAIIEFSKVASLMFSSITNVTIATYGTNTVNDLLETLSSFEKEAQDLVVQLYSSHTRIALLNKNVYASFSPIMTHLVPLNTEILGASYSIRKEILDIKSKNENAMIDVNAISKSKLSNKFTEAFDAYDLLIKTLSENTNFPELLNLSKIPSRSRNIRSV